jgi:hypothetical protein
VDVGVLASFSKNLQKIVVVGYFVPSDKSERLTPLCIRQAVSSWQCGKIISHGWLECEWAYCYQLFVIGAPWIRISHIICIEMLKHVGVFLIIRAISLSI